jgi:cobalt-zinc-cadmium efflux system membrane fusion protein
LKVRVVLANPKHTLKSDMFATIRVPGAIRTAFILPATAVLHEGEKTFVFLQDPAGKFNQRVVTVGRSIDAGPVKSIEVLTGLNDGDKVVSIGGALLRPTSGE